MKENNFNSPLFKEVSAEWLVKTLTKLVNDVKILKVKVNLLYPLIIAILSIVGVFVLKK
jgi:hypothetical protein